jgi:hypothetical protein
LAELHARRRTALLRFAAGQEGDPSSRRALLWMTAKGGLGGRAERLGEEDRSWCGSIQRFNTEDTEKGRIARRRFGAGASIGGGAAKPIPLA